MFSGLLGSVRALAGQASGAVEAERADLVIDLVGLVVPAEVLGATDSWRDRCLSRYATWREGAMSDVLRATDDALDHLRSALADGAAPLRGVLREHASDDDSVKRQRAGTAIELGLLAFYGTDVHPTAPAL